MMKATIIHTMFGVLAFDEGNRLIAHSIFQKKPEEAAKTIVEIESGKTVKEVAELINYLKHNGYDSFVFENPLLAAEIKERFGGSVEVSKVSEAGELLRSNMEGFALETGFVRDYEELRRWLHSVAVEIAKIRVKRAVEKRDLIIAQAIQTLDDLDKTINLFMSRIREWYGIHFPELDRLLEKHETYARLVLNIGNKEGFTSERLEAEGLPKAKAEQIANAAQSSMGADLPETDLTQIKVLCKNVLSLYELRQTLEAYIDTAMEEVAPNIKAITGSLLGARLIALAGGLTNLAKMPASTLQVLGAEKALFRSLKTGTRPPKHGIIFQHPFLHEAKKWQRGKIARALAGKLAIAARIDVFGGRYIGEELKADLEKRVEEIRQKYTEPPTVPERKPKPRHEMKRRKRRHAR
ncbi:MAG: C/D box methylation guide ribonucleoprotein complex aNOP56 subunit [Candidatus Bathyarchaeota archaeon]|jgi:nucleolar protein 56|nr:C/D box methylation guide ribonucleoprotein complex aNOP56 subunit [Candidatus Bathyarchaeota archaeon A05DMB-3]MDH7607538.1 C/D box methylation guide ribonucleoprotein complex aNOP56 subunit [Candidatus Bathyarchaeota archaeon]